MRKDLLELLFALQDNLDYEEVIKLLIKYDKNGLIFLLLEDPRLKLNVKKDFILEVFKYSLVREQLSVTVRILSDYKCMLLKEAATLNQYIVTCFARSPFFYEIKLYVLEDFFKTMDYHQCDRLIEAISNHFLV